MNDQHPSLVELMVKTSVVHMVTYFLMGLLASTFLDYADLSDSPVFLLSNRWHWQASGITRIRRTAQYDRALRDKPQGQLKLELDGSVSFWRHVTQAQSLWSLALFIQAGLTQGQSLHAIMDPLLRTMCPA